MSEANRIISAINDLKKELPIEIWQRYRDGQNAGRDSSRSKSFQLSLAAERAELANSRALATATEGRQRAKDQAAHAAAFRAFVENKDKSREELIAAVEEAAARGARSVSVDDVVAQIEVDTQIRVKDSDDEED